MEIYINGNKTDYTPLFPITWKNFFHELLQDEDYIPKDHGIVTVFVDGMDSFQLMREQSEKIILENTSRIEITTKNSLAVAHDGFQKVMAILENVKKEIIAAAKLFREENINEASFKIIKILETIKPIAIFINSVDINFSLNIDQIPFDANITLREKVEKFLETIDELVDAQQEQDYVKLADYLEFRLVEDMNDLNKIVHILLQRIYAIETRSPARGEPHSARALIA